MLNSQSIDGILINIFMFAIMLIYAIKNRQCVNRKPPILTHIMIILFCVFAFWDTDYYGYIESLKLIDFRFPNAEQQTHLEPLYIWIGNFANGNYSLFRLFIWLAAYILFLKTLQNLNICNKQTVALFIVYFLLTFSYARASLGITSLFYGVSIILKSDKRRLINICIGLALFILAYHAHKSMFIALALFPLVFIRLNKYTLIFFIISFIAVAVLAGEAIISELLLTNAVNDEYGEFIQESATGYITSDTKATGIAAQLLYIIQITSLALPIAYYYMNTNVSKYISSNFTLRCFTNYSTLLVLIGIAFGIVLSFNSPISYRLMFMAYIPNIIIISTLYKNQVFPQKHYNRFLLLFTLYSVLRLLYTLYNQLVS